MEVLREMLNMIMNLSRKYGMALRVHVLATYQFCPRKILLRLCNDHMSLHEPGGRGDVRVKSWY